MTTKELLGIVKNRGLVIVVKEGRPVILAASVKPGAVTDKLLAALKIHRERIVTEITRPVIVPVVEKPKEQPKQEVHGDAWEGP